MVIRQRPLFPRPAGAASRFDRRFSPLLRERRRSAVEPGGGGGNPPPQASHRAHQAELRDATDAARARPTDPTAGSGNHRSLFFYKAIPSPTGSAALARSLRFAFPQIHRGKTRARRRGEETTQDFASCAIPAAAPFLSFYLPFNSMDSDYVASLLMGSSAAPALDFAALDTGFLDTLCGGGAGAGLFGVPGVAAAGAGCGGGSGGGSPEGSSVSDPAWARARDDGNVRKRKAPPTGSAGGKEAFLGKAAEAKVPDGKRCRVGASDSPVKPKEEEAAASDASIEVKGHKKGKGKSPKPAAEPPKDYVHVRARRGQATDSHSLAERVRREKISQRMKFLQDLVPGCNKVVGKALMLDEIINYVQSLQQQVEFLSMKLATVNPQLDFSNLSTLLHKDIYQPCGPSANSVFPLESAGAAFPFCDQADLFQSFASGAMEDQCSLSLLDTVLPHTANPQFAFQKQQRDFWEDGLHNALPTGSEQRQEDGLLVPNFDGQLQADQAKIEF